MFKFEVLIQFLYSSKSEKVLEVYVPLLTGILCKAALLIQANTGFISAKILILKNELEHYYVQHKQSETKKVIVYFKPKQILQVWEPTGYRGAA